MQDLNVGTMLRTAHCLGCEELVISGKQKISPQGTQGSKYFLPSHHVYSVKEAISYCKAQNFEVIGVEIGGTCLSEVVFDKNTAFIFGNEGSGIAETTLSQCDRVITIPQYGVIASMNVSTASGIVMWEFKRQQIVRWGRAHPDCRAAIQEGRKFFPPKPIFNLRDSDKHRNSSLAEEIKPICLTELKY